MPLFIIERRFADALDLDAEGAALIKQVNDAAGVNWLYSFLSADRRKTYCLYEAPNVEAPPEPDTPAEEESEPTAQQD